MTVPLRAFSKGVQIPAIGFGAMGIAFAYGPGLGESNAHEVLARTIEEGATSWDTADIYTDFSSGKLGLSEEYIGSFFKKNPGSREKVFLATKFGHIITKEGGMGMRGDKEWVHQACSDSLQRLGVEYIDLYYAHRPTQDVEIEETVGAMKELKDAGKIKFIGVSEYNLEQLERVNKIVHIDALQIELSAWTPNSVHNGILAWCEKNGTALFAYSPLGRGALTDKDYSLDSLHKDDWRRTNPRFQKEAFEANSKLVDNIKELAKKLGATTGQVALAWCLAQSENVFVIPGTKNPKYVTENSAAGKVKIPAEDLKALNEKVAAFEAVGDRYPGGDDYKKVIAF